LAVPHGLDGAHIDLLIDLCFSHFTFTISLTRSPTISWIFPHVYIRRWHSKVLSGPVSFGYLVHHPSSDSFDGAKTIGRSPNAYARVHLLLFWFPPKFPYLLFWITQLLCINSTTRTDSLSRTISGSDSIRLSLVPLQGTKRHFQSLNNMLLSWPITRSPITSWSDRTLHWHNVVGTFSVVLPWFYYERPFKHAGVERL
jgi:hypothetical protein